MSTVGSLGELIFAARTARGWTIEEAASRIGRTHTWLWRIEKGKNANPPSPAELRDIGKVLGLSSLEMLEALGYLDPPDKHTVEEGGGSFRTTIPDGVTDILRTIDWDESTIKGVVPVLRLIRDSQQARAMNKDERSEE